MCWNHTQECVSRQHRPPFVAISLYHLAQPQNLQTHSVQTRPRETHLSDVACAVQPLPEVALDDVLQHTRSDTPHILSPYTLTAIIPQNSVVITGHLQYVWLPLPHCNTDDNARPVSPQQAFQASQHKAEAHLHINIYASPAETACGHHQARCPLSLTAAP